MTWLRQSLTSPFGIYVRGFFSFSFSRLKLFTPKIGIFSKYLTNCLSV